MIETEIDTAIKNGQLNRPYVEHRIEVNDRTILFLEAQLKVLKADNGMFRMVLYRMDNPDGK